MQDLYTEDYKIVLRKIKEDLNKWRDISCPWAKRLHIVKLAIFPKLIYILNAIPILKKNSDFLFTEIDKLTLKFIWKF